MQRLVSSWRERPGAGHTQREDAGGDGRDASRSQGAHRRRERGMEPPPAEAWSRGQGPAPRAAIRSVAPPTAGSRPSGLRTAREHISLAFSPRVWRGALSLQPVQDLPPGRPLPAQPAVSPRPLLLPEYPHSPGTDMPATGVGSLGAQNVRGPCARNEPGSFEHPAREGAEGHGPCRALWGVPRGQRRSPLNPGLVPAATTRAQATCLQLLPRPGAFHRCCQVPEEGQLAGEAPA